MAEMPYRLLLGACGDGSEEGTVGTIGLGADSFSWSMIGGIGWLYSYYMIGV